MTLHIKNHIGKEVELTPTVSTRLEIVETAGETFTIGASDYLYHAHEVYAKASPDTSLMISILMAIFAFFVTTHLQITAVAFIAMYIISKIYFYYDKKAVEKFNQSTTY